MSTKVDEGKTVRERPVHQIIKIAAIQLEVSQKRNNDGVFIERLRKAARVKFLGKTRSGLLERIGLSGSRRADQNRTRWPFFQEALNGKMIEPIELEIGCSFGASNSL